LRELRQWYFDIKAHIGEDPQSGLVYTVVPTAANVIEPLSGSLGRTHGWVSFAFEDTLMSIFQGLLFLLLGAGLLCAAPGLGSQTLRRNSHKKLSAASLRLSSEVTV